MEHSEYSKLRVAQYLRENVELQAALGINCNALFELHHLGMGEHNLNYWFKASTSEQKYVLRVNVTPQPFHDDQVLYEYEALKAIEPSGCTPKALYLDNSSKALGKGTLVVEYCEGDELDFDHLRPGDLRCAAQLMANIHAVDIGDNCFVHRPEDPLRELFAECMQRFEFYVTSAFEDARVTKWVEAFIEATKPQLNTKRYDADCTHIVNTETLPSHFLIPEGSAIQAASASGDSGMFCVSPGTFVDWERPIIGEVAQDVSYFVSPTTTFWDSEYLFPANQIEGFIEDYWRAVNGRFEPGNFDERFRAFFMVTALRNITWCCRALVQFGSNPNLHRTKRAERKLPIYLSDDFMQLLATECFNL